MIPKLAQALETARKRVLAYSNNFKEHRKKRRSKLNNSCNNNNYNNNDSCNSYIQHKQCQSNARSG